ncbi:hypothetical protein C463_05110 [Halorubrum californiense DSM 19288]|uniref:STAS/SEC14 domain-containing protein n=1 Tax=Halorubrum californiense DSM 19288 TaxID=1227465 RepID=M0EFD4_9EURY|nr:MULTISPECIES: hypothetical protein [Halorubrum]ELZ45788.1 hypothetical protein C463_05110 [Halorubrum californiense DSM 19288]TKX66164.1 hypothetical protein EXE40_16140 [Halorubrum sp. GN11GM_10-3_MGM]
MEPSERWLLRVEDEVLVVEFPHGTGLSPADSEALLDRWRDAAGPDRIDAVVIVVRTSRPCSDAGRRALRESAQIAVARGVDRFAVVGQRSKRRFLKRTIDVEEVDTESFNDDESAMRWAKCPSAAPSSVETSS